MSEPETTKVVEPAESVKRSKLDKVKSAVATTAWIVIPVTVFGGLTYLSLKTTSMQLETAKLNLETAKLNK